MRLLPEHRKGAYIMCDSNEIKELKKDKLVDRSKSSVLLLKELMIEYEEKLYSVKIQLKTQQSLLKQYESELLERERTKIHNIDLFSPIYKSSQAEKDLPIAIDNINKKIEDLNKDCEQLEKRIAGLKTAVQIVDHYDVLVTDDNEKHSDHIIENRQIVNDKGLSILEAQEIERQRIARDLHDSTVQNLTSLVHKTELCIKLIEIDSIRAKLELNSMSNTIKTVINEMRGIIYNLKPMSLDDIGLTVTVERYAGRLMDLNNINVIVRSNEETKEIHPVIKLTLFRIIQEACNNVIKHANATTINIDIIYDECLVNVSIKDNGSGFSLNNTHSGGDGHSSSFGLSIIKERISLLSGTVDIKSEKDYGTTVTVSAPLTIYEGDKNEQTS
jgi:two-component system sensor histidine kinase DegS